MSNSGTHTLFDLRAAAESPTGFQQQLAAMSRLFGAGDEFGLSEPPLLVPDDTVVRWPGSAVPVLGQRFDVTPSGVLVPQGCIPAPMHGMAVYMTSEQALGRWYSLPQLQMMVSEVPLIDLLSAIGALMVFLRREGVTDRQAQLRLVEDFCVGDTKRIASALVRDRWLFLAPQPLLAAAKLALVAGDPSRVRPGADALQVAIVASLGIAAHLGVSASADSSRWRSMPAGLSLEIVANQHFNSTAEVGGALATYDSLWVDLPRRRDPELAAAHEEAFHQATGVTLDQCFTVGMLLWAHAYAQKTARYAPDFANVNGFCAVDLTALNLFAVDVDEAQVLLMEEIERVGLDWSANTFRRFPLIRHPDGSMTLIDPELLVRRTCGSAAHWEINNALRRDRKKWGDFKRFRGLVIEDHVGEALEAMAVQPACGVKRVWREDELRAAWPGRKNCDFAVDYGWAWVCVEVVSHGLSEPAVTASSVERLDADLEMMVEQKALQLEGTVTALLEDEQTLTGQPSGGTKRIYPLIVAGSGFALNPITASVIRERLAADGVLQHPRIGELEVVDLDDLHYLESAHERIGRSLPEILSAKSTSQMAGAPMDQYLHAVERSGLHRPRRFKSAMDSRWAVVLEAVHQRQAQGSDRPAA